MKLAVDTETALIAPGRLAPPLACLSYSDGESTGLLHHEDAADFAKAALSDFTIVGHNVAFDLAVLAKHHDPLTKIIFGAYTDNRIRDTLIRQSLADIRTGDFVRTRGKMGLDALAERHLGRYVPKGDDTWRKRFGELIPLPLDRWPAEARAYAETDAEVTYRVHERQTEAARAAGWIAAPTARVSPDEALQTRAAFALHLLGVAGVHTDRAAIDALELRLRTELDQLTEGLVIAGIVRPNGTRDMGKIKALVEAALGERTPRTAPSAKFHEGQVQTDADALDAAAEASGDHSLIVLQGFSERLKVLSTYIPALRAGEGNLPSTARFNPLVESGRTSCSGGSAGGTNWQNLPRAPGVRECVIPRSGRVLVAVDYDTAELRALAQICFSWFGHSKLREAFLAGRDPHLELGARLLGISSEEAHRRKDEEAVADKRQLAKVPNFGFPGGLGPSAFVSYARGFDLDITLDQAKALKNEWRRAWPEMGPYFEVIGEATSETSKHEIVQYRSGRVRGGVSFTEAANGYFQGLVADFAKDALWHVVRECYSASSSPLYGCVPILFIHDEIILEAPEEQAHDAAMRTAQIMEETGSMWCPDVPIKASPHLMRRWYKKAKAVFDEQGRLIPWEPKP